MIAITSTTPGTRSGTPKRSPASRKFYDSRSSFVVLAWPQSLHYLLNSGDCANVALLVLANKQDLPGAMPVAEVAQRLELHKIKDRKWFIQGCSAPTGDGLWEGMDWLSNSVSKRTR